MWSITGIQRVGRQALSEGYLLKLPGGLECRIARLCATDIQKLIEKGVRRQKREDYLDGDYSEAWLEEAQSEIGTMRDHYFPRYVTAIFTKKRVRFGLVVDLGKDFWTHELLTQWKVCTLIQTIKRGKPLDQDGASYGVVCGFIGRQVYDAKDRRLKCILKAVRHYTTPQTAALLV